MQQININELKAHPRNNEFFDDMSGEKWKEFLESIKTRGVIEPIVITPNKVIVSGHQRVRACKELGIKTVMCDVHTYNNDDEILQDLLETNIRQRGDVGGSAKKVGLRIKELEWFPSSKMCHCCGTIKEDLQLSDRWYVCDCGYENDRDYNAAMNIRDCGTRLLAW